MAPWSVVAGSLPLRLEVAVINFPGGVLSALS